MKVQAVVCSVCHDTVYSRARHDMRSCSCGAVSIDGGRDYTKVSWDPNIPATKVTTIEVVGATEKELYKDWNEQKNYYGIRKFHESRLVSNGRAVSRPFAWSDKRDYDPFLIVHMGRCSPPCACDGWEVCLHFNATYVKSPVWPIMSARSFREAKEIATDVRAFARGFEPKIFDEWDEEVNGSKILADWLKEQGFSRRNHVVWGK